MSEGASGFTPGEIARSATECDAFQHGAPARPAPLARAVLSFPRMRRLGLPRVAGSTLGAVTLGLALATASCDHRPPPAPTPAPRAGVTARVTSVSQPGPSPRQPSPQLPSDTADTALAMPSPPPNVVEDKTAAGLPGVKAGELSEIGPAAPASATSEGVVLVSRDERVFVVPRQRGTRPEKLRFEPLDAGSTSFAPLGRGPSVARGFAYWVSHGRLVRRALAGDGPLEVLAEDAREASRVAAGVLGEKTVVAFIAKPDEQGTSHARLWIEGGKTLTLTPDGAGSSSVSLATSGDHLLATSIDGRSAMTPMHARTLKLGATGPELGPDVVVWVGGPAQRWTETFVGTEAGRVYAHVPIERDVTHFGLATVNLGSEPHMDSEVAFFDYANGLDLAPVAAAELCGHAHVAYVRPTTSIPHSPAELVLVRVATGEAMIVANARGFASTSMVALENGGLLTYVADARTWALGLGCH